MAGRHISGTAVKAAEAQRGRQMGYDGGESQIPHAPDNKNLASRSTRGNHDGVMAAILVVTREDR